jgi:hypothetical protein
MDRMHPPGSGGGARFSQASASRRRGLAGLIIRRPKTIAVATWAVSLAAGASALVLADFGGPPWVFILLGLWLLTAGLPALAGTLLVASFTQGLPVVGTLPLGPAVAAMALASLGLQASACVAAGRLLARRAPRGAR